MDPSDGKDRRSPASQRQEKGFTLLEVMIALFILAFGLLAIATMQATAIKSNSQAMGLTEAANLAQDRMEKLINLFYTHDDLNDTDGDGPGGLDHTGAGADHTIVWTAPNGVTYTVYWNIAADEPIQNVKTIRMVVRWPDRGLMRTATFDFMKSEVK
jgi:type IV pilus assembly protein PilV